MERFVNNESLYPQEWNDFIDCGQENPETEAIRRRCDEVIQPLLEEQGEVAEKAIAEVHAMIRWMRNQP